MNTNEVTAIGLEVTPMDMAILLAGVGKVMEEAMRAEEADLPNDVKAMGVAMCMELMMKLNAIVEHAMREAKSEHDGQRVTSNEPMKS